MGRAEGAKAAGGYWYLTQMTYLGRDYIALAFQQYYRNRIDDAQLSQYLDTKPQNIATLEDYFSKSHA